MLIGFRTSRSLIHKVSFKNPKLVLLKVGPFEFVGKKRQTGMSAGTVDVTVAFDKETREKYNIKGALRSENDIKKTFQ